MRILSFHSKKHQAKMIRHNIYFDLNGEGLVPGDWVTVNDVERTIVREDEGGLHIFTEEDVLFVIKAH